MLNYSPTRDRTLCLQNRAPVGTSTQMVLYYEFVRTLELHPAVEELPWEVKASACVQRKHFPILAVRTLTLVAVVK